MNVHKHFEDRVGLAQIYLLDGAFHSAAKCLETLARDLRVTSYRSSPHPPMAQDIVDEVQATVDKLKEMLE